MTMPIPPVTIHPGDAIGIAVLNAKDFNVKTRVESDGTVELPLVGPIVISGLTTEGAQREIRERLRSRDMVNEGQVVVAIEQSTSITVSVTGQVTQPGNYPAYGQRTLVDYLGDAHGLKDNGSSVVTLIRPTLPAPVQIDLGSNPATSLGGAIPIYPGDTIVVPSTGFVYAVGAFKSQGVFPLKNHGSTTVVQLAAEAGGANFEGNWNKAIIVRRGSNAPQEIPVHLADILNHQAPDVAIQADDILYLPSNDGKAALKGGAAGIAAALAAAFIYARP